MSVLAIDIGGTKFTMALFERAEPERGHPPATARGEQGGARWTMTRRESRATDRTGGPAWMTARIAEIAAVWREESDFDRIGVGFGGPVHFATQKVVLSTHVGGWEGFDLVEWLRAHFKLPVRMDNDANTGALGEGLYGAGRGCRPLFYMTLSTGIGGGILTEDGVLRGADSYAGEIGHMTIRPGGPECLCGAFGCFERICGGMGLERDHGRPAEALLRDPLLRDRSGLGSEGCHHDPESCQTGDRGGHRQGWRCPVRAAAGRVGPADYGLVEGADRRGAGRAGGR